MTLRRSFNPAVAIVLTLLVSACSGSPLKEMSSTSGDENWLDLSDARNPAALEVKEASTWYQTTVETQSDSARPWATSLDAPANGWDVRGVGDSAWTYPGGKGSRPEVPIEPGFRNAIDKIDPSHKLFNGHLGFANWESVVGSRCSSIRQSVDFYFLSRPQSLLEAVERGFNIIGLSNNHAQDCNGGKAFDTSTPHPGPLMSVESMKWIEKKAEVVWAGVGEDQTSEDPMNAHVTTMQIGGRRVRVAFGAVALLSWDIPNSGSLNFSDRNSLQARANKILKSLGKADADLRILSIHTQDATGDHKPEAQAFLALKLIAEKFVKDYRGSIVFGEGPHTWGGVRVIERSPEKGGGRGVIFTSLGNFVHQGLGSNSDNYIARALFDANFNLNEVQVIPFVNQKTQLSFFKSPGATKKPRSNFEWKSGLLNAGSKEVAGFAARFAE